MGENMPIKHTSSFRNNYRVMYWTHQKVLVEGFFLSVGALKNYLTPTQILKKSKMPPVKGPYDF